MVEFLNEGFQIIINLLNSCKRSININTEAIKTTDSSLPQSSYESCEKTLTDSKCSLSNSKGSPKSSFDIGIISSSQRKGLCNHCHNYFDCGFQLCKNHFYCEDCNTFLLNLDQISEICNDCFQVFSQDKNNPQVRFKRFDPDTIKVPISSNIIPNFKILQEKVKLNLKPIQSQKEKSYHAPFDEQEPIKKTFLDNKELLNQYYNKQEISKTGNYQTIRNTTVNEKNETLNKKSCNQVFIISEKKYSQEQISYKQGPSKASEYQVSKGNIGSQGFIINKDPAILKEISATQNPFLPYHQETLDIQESSENIFSSAFCLCKICSSKVKIFGLMCNHNVCIICISINGLNQILEHERKILRSMNNNDKFSYMCPVKECKNIVSFPTAMILNYIVSNCLARTYGIDDQYIHYLWSRIPFYDGLDYLE